MDFNIKRTYGHSCEIDFLIKQPVDGLACNILVSRATHLMVSLVESFVDSYDGSVKGCLIHWHLLSQNTANLTKVWHLDTIFLQLRSHCTDLFLYKQTGM